MELAQERNPVNVILTSGFHKPRCYCLDLYLQSPHLLCLNPEHLTYILHNSKMLKSERPKYNIPRRKATISCTNPLNETS